MIDMVDKEKTVLQTMSKPGKPVKPGYVAKITSLESKEVSKITNNLKKKGKVSILKRCYYAPAKLI
jgi:hypothetical protein